MAQIERKWISDSAINSAKLDSSDSYTVAGLTANGNVGINVTPAVDQLHIRSASGSAAVRLDADNASGRSYQVLSDNLGNFAVKDVDAGGTSRLVMDATGHLGVGSIQPLAEFQVSTTGTPTRVNLSTTGGSGRTYQVNSDLNGRLNIVDVGADQTRAFVDSNGNLTINKDTTMQGGLMVNGTTTIVNQKIIVSDRMEINGDGVPDSTVLAIRQTNASATSRLVVVENAGSGAALTVVGVGSGSSNVGIGTTSPSEKLTVAGAIRATGDIYKDENAANGQYEHIRQVVRNADSWDSDSEIYTQVKNNADNKSNYTSLVAHGGANNPALFGLTNTYSAGILLYNDQNSNPVYLGCFTSNDLVLGTSNTERMRIT